MEMKKWEMAEEAISDGWCNTVEEIERYCMDEHGVIPSQRTIRGRMRAMGIKPAIPPAMPKPVMSPGAAKAWAKVKATNAHKPRRKPPAVPGKPSKKKVTDQPPKIGQPQGKYRSVDADWMA